MWLPTSSSSCCDELILEGFVLLPKQKRFVDDFYHQKLLAWVEYILHSAETAAFSNLMWYSLKLDAPDKKNTQQWTQTLTQQTSTFRTSTHNVYSIVAVVVRFSASLWEEGALIAWKIILHSHMAVLKLFLKTLHSFRWRKEESRGGSSKVSPSKNRVWAGPVGWKSDLWRQWSQRWRGRNGRRSQAKIPKAGLFRQTETLVR